MVNLIFRTIFLYITIIVAIRLMGKRQIGDLQTSELVVTLLISDIASMPMENIGKPLLSGLLPIFILVACEIFLSLLMLKHSKLRRAVCGKPIVIINKGKICQSEMKMLRMSVEDLFEQLRQNEVFSLNDVLYAIVETNGKMSILKKENDNDSTDSDSSNEKQSNQDSSEQTSNLDVVVVSNGKISDSSCRLFEISHDDVKKAAKKKHINLKDIFVMTANENGDYKIVKKESQK